MLTADGSRLSPAVGCFQATLTLGNRSYVANIQVHDEPQTPLLLYDHCHELAIISPDFPRSILEMTDVNRCVEMTLPAPTSPEAAQDYFLWEPLQCDDQPTRRFKSVSAVFFQVAGKSFLVIVNILSGWPVIFPCGKDTTSVRVIRMFCRYFREVGVLLRLRTDGGPPFTSADFKNFDHVVTSPHYPQFNVHAKAAVKATKHLIIKTAPI